MTSLRESPLRLILLYWLPVAMYAGLIFYLSSQPSPDIVLPPWFFQHEDKVLHAGAYAVLGVLWYRAFRYAAGSGFVKYASFAALAATVLYGMSDEVHQAFVPSRHPDGWDVLADAVGGFIGIHVWQALPLLFSSKSVSES